MFEVMPNFTWLPWYLQLLIGFPIALFIIMAVFKLVMSIIEIVVKVKGIFLR